MEDVKILEDCGYFGISVLKSNMSHEVFTVRNNVSVRPAWTPLLLVLHVYVCYFRRMLHFLLPECVIVKSYFNPPSLRKRSLVIAVRSLVDS